MMLSPLARHLVGQALRTPHALRFEAAARRPGRAQAALLARIVAAGRDSELGRRLGLGRVDFAKLPFMTAADLAGWSERLMRGERNLLTRDPPVFYAETTGTAGKHKIVPVTASYRADFQAGVHTALSHLWLRFPAAFTSRFLYFVAPRREAIAPDGLDVGAMSGFNYTELPPIARTLYAWPYELFSVRDPAARAYLALHQAIAGDVSLVGGVFPLPIIQLLRDLETQADVLEHDLRRGTLDGASALSAAERAPFAIPPRPDLADRVARARRAPVEEKVACALPSLRLCYCWTTATAGLYVPELRRRLGPRVAVRDAIYAASEAWCNVTLGDDDPGGPAALLSAYLEFIPEEELGSPAPRAIPVEALEDGRRYAVVCTTSSGLYRYLLEDLVETCGRHRATPRIRFVRKLGASSNLAGELLDESHVTRAVGAALAAAGVEATWFSLVADAAGELPGYRLHLEPAPGQPDPDMASLALDVDRRLSSLAMAFGELVGTQLRRTTGVLVPRGRWERWRRARLAAGGGDAQLKATHLVPAGASLPVELAP